jgi:hypothetical protein
VSEGMAVSPTSRPAGPRWRPAVLAWALWGLTLLGLAAAAWLDRLLRQAGLSELVSPPPSSISQVVAAVSAATVGAVLAARRPRHPVGWLLLGVGLSITAHALTYGYTRYGLVARPGALPAAGYLAGFNNGVVLSWIACAGFVLLLAPTGRLPSPRWRWWARTAAAAALVWLLASVVHPTPLYPEYPAIGNPLAVPAIPRGLLEVTQPAAGVVVLASLVVGAVSLVGRFRRARGVERLQLRWLAWGAVLAAAALLVALASLRIEEDFTVLDLALGVCAALLPLATGAAILRYRLYDLDRIISRTIAYGQLTVLLGSAYAGVVLGLGRLLPQGSSLGVAGATLAVAAAFQPARRRLQQAVDRRFNRRHYDAAHTVAAFSARLRQHVDLDSLTAELLAVAEETMQPTQSSLWLRPSDSAASNQRMRGTSGADGRPTAAGSALQLR